MDTALIVMGVAVPGGAPVFCYAQLRSVIAAGDYGPLTLPRSAAPANHRRVAVMKAFELVSWRRRLSDDELAAFRSGLSAGTVSLPDDCPIEPGKTINGETFPDTYILETSDYVPVAGAGVLTSRGLCSADAVPDIVNLLIAAFGRAEVGDGVQALLTAIDDEIGSPNLVAETRRLGVVEDLRRSSSATAADLLRVAVAKVDARSDDACLQLRIIREPVVTARRDLRVVVRMKTSTFEVVRRLILIPADTDEQIVDSPSHIVEAELQVFDARDGEFLQLVDTWFTQGFLLSMTMMGATDLLPTPFSSAPHSPDLIARPRFEGGGPKTRLGFGNRSGGFDVLKATADIVDQLAGKRDEKLESRFFEAGHQSQVEVIRWIKSQLENTDVEEAFLLDPYLGRPAMERVILRNGSESLKLTLMVSPGAVDPDAEKMDAIVGSGLHVQGLVAAAEALKSQLCGEVEIIHVERGSDQRQAFHDRYLGLKLQDGTPRVFVLSNSLSKAAGAWPFAIAEVDRRAAWRIAAYVSALRRGLENGHPVTSTVIWRSGPRESQYEVPEATAFQSALWELHGALCEVCTGSDDVDPEPYTPLVDQLLACLPEDQDVSDLGTAVFKGMYGRDRSASLLAGWIEDRHGHEALGRAVAAAQLDEILQQVAPKDGRIGRVHLQIDSLVLAGLQLSRTPKGTDVIRDRLNPAAEHCMLWLELGGAGDRSLRALSAVFAIVLIGLETARQGVDLVPAHRTGLATDYVALLARVLRTDTAREWLALRDDLAPDTAIVRRCLAAAEELASDLHGPVAATWRRLSADPLCVRPLPIADERSL